MVTRAVCDCGWSTAGSAQWVQSWVNRHTCRDTITSPRPHGTRSKYAHDGCRCRDCQRANTHYAKRLELRQLAGTVDLVDAAPVRAHIDRLRATGLGRRGIAKAAGVAESVVNRLAGVDQSKPARRVRSATARKILAVTPTDVPGGSLVDGTGTRRRLRALIALGWTQRDIAALIGWAETNLSGLVLRDDEQVTARTARTVADAYDRVSGTPGGSQRSRRRAAARGWVPPLAWDDDLIDDPTHQPDVTAIRRANNRRKVHPDDIAELLDQGETLDGIAQRFGVTPAAIDRARYRQRDAS